MEPFSDKTFQRKNYTPLQMHLSRYQKLLMFNIQPCEVQSSLFKWIYINLHNHNVTVTNAPDNIQCRRDSWWWIAQLNTVDRYIFIPQGNEWKPMAAWNGGKNTVRHNVKYMWFVIKKLKVPQTHWYESLSWLWPLMTKLFVGILSSPSLCVTVWKDSTPPRPPSVNLHRSRCAYCKVIVNDLGK